MPRHHEGTDPNGSTDRTDRDRRRFLGSSGCRGCGSRLHRRAGPCPPGEQVLEKQRWQATKKSPRRQEHGELSRKSNKHKAGQQATPEKAATATWRPGHQAQALVSGKKPNLPSTQAARFKQNKTLIRTHHSQQHPTGHHVQCASRLSPWGPADSKHAAVPQFHREP